MNQCSYCHSTQLYTLSNGYIKCAKCKKKESPKRHERIRKLIHAFCEDKTALTISKELQLNYVTVTSHFHIFRKLITNFLDENNQRETTQSNEYDEYMYMKNDNLYNAQNFITFVYERRIYNLMMPSLHKFRTYSKDEEELSKFLFLNKIAKLESRHGLISEFWNYLEEFLKKFKGVNSGNFIYYLKEAEYKFNYSKEFQEATLLKLYYQT